MVVQALRTEGDYNEALAIVSKLVDAEPEPGAADGVRLEIITALIEQYEAKHFG